MEAATEMKFGTKVV